MSAVILLAWFVVVAEATGITAVIDDLFLSILSQLSLGALDYKIWHYCGLIQISFVANSNFGFLSILFFAMYSGEG